MEAGLRMSPRLLGSGGARGHFLVNVQRHVLNMFVHFSAGFGGAAGGLNASSGAFGGSPREEIGGHFWPYVRPYADAWRRMAAARSGTDSLAMRYRDAGDRLS